MRAAWRWAREMYRFGGGEMKWCSLHQTLTTLSCSVRSGAGVRVLEQDDRNRILAISSNGGVLGHINGFFCRFSLRSVYVTSIPSVDNKILPACSNCRLIGTLAYVDEQEVVKALDLFISTAKDDPVSTKQMCSIYIKMLCRSGNLPDAAYLLRHLQDKQIYLGLSTYNILLTAAGEANNFDLFSKIFKILLLSSVPPDLTSYLNVAKAFQNVTDSDPIQKFVREVSEITIDREPTVMNRIIFVVAKSGQIDKGIMIFEEMKNLKCKMDEVTFNSILAILGKAGRVDQMLYEFTLMKGLGHTPDIVTYNTLINCLRRLGRLDQCKIFAREMLEKRIVLDLRTYTALIDGFGRAGQLQDALRIFSEMKKSHQPSIYVYRALISDLKKAGKFELAVGLLEEMNSSTSKLVGPEDFKRQKGKKGRRNSGDRGILDSGLF